MAKLFSYGFYLLICWFYEGAVISVLADPNYGDARLVEGGAPSQGRVEIYINGSWSTVCDSWFGYEEGRVLCNQLGLPRLSQVYYGAYFGEGNGSILTEEYDCQGNETSLLDCFKTGYHPYCGGHYQDVGIACGPFVAAECGGLVKEPLEELSFQKGDKVTENECQWNIGDIYEPNGDHVILAIDPVYSCSFRIVVKDGYGKNLLYSYCGLRERAFLSTSTLNISVEVRAYSRYNTFTVRYAILNGSIYKAPLVDGWNVTVVNASESSISFQWPNLTDVRLGNQVRAYVAIVETTDGKEITGDIVFPNVTSITLSGLEGGTEYRLFAVVVDVLGQPHRSSEVLLFTEEGVPSRSPYVSVNNNYPGGDSINISIHPIPEKYHNGKLLGYNIKYRTSCYGIPNFSAQVDVSASTRSYILTGLLPGKQYYIRVAGFTSKGIGPYYWANAFTTCEPQRTLTAKNGTLYSPNYPCSFRGLHYCRWTIEPQLGGSTVKAIWINFNSFQVGDGPYCRSNNWLRVATGEETQYNNDTLLCGYIEPFSLVVHGDQSELALQYTNTYRYSNGFSVWYLGLEDPLIDTDLLSWQLLVHNITSSSAAVEWEAFPLNVSISYFMVMFTEENTNISVLFKVWSLYDRNYFVNKLLKPNRVYEFQVLAFTVGVENVTYSTKIQTITTGQEAPSRAPTNVRVRNFQPNEILVLWDAVKPQYTNGQIQGYTVHYRNYDYYYYYYYYYGDNAKNVTINDPNVFQMVLRGLNGGRKYQIAVSAFTSVGEGPRSPWISFVVGCGGNFNQSFGTIHLQKSDYSELQCNWTIGSVRITNAVILLSLKELRFYYCGSEFLKVFSSSGSEIFTRARCFEDHRDVVELQFGEGNFVTLQTQLYSRYSRLNIEFVIVRRSLHSALSPSSAWNIHGFNTSQKSLFVDWSNVPRDLPADIFILSLNQTRPRLYYKDGGRSSFLIIVDSSNTSVNVSDLPVFSQYIVLVYLVDVNGDIYKSDSIVVQTDEGVPRRGPYLYNWNINVRDHSISFTREDIRPEDAQGRILGYNITHAQLDELNNTKWMITDTNTTRITLSNLEEGSTYLIAVAGFTRKGTGEYAVATVTLCGGYLTEDSNYFSSPDKPFSHNFYYVQYEDSSCHWNINPQSETSMIWLTFAELSLGRRYDDYCSGGVRISVPVTAGKGDADYHDYDDKERFLLEVCGQLTNETMLIEAETMNIRADGFKDYRYDPQLNNSRVLGHYKAEHRNITTITGETLDFWTEIQANASYSSIDLSWTPPPSSFLGVSSVQKYLILYNSISARGYYGALWLPADKTQVNISRLELFTNYSLILVAILTDETQRGNTGWIQVQTEEGVPSRSPYIHDYRAINYNTIRIRWGRLSPKYVRGNLKGYRIYYTFAFKYYYGWSVRNITVGPDVLDMTITGLQPNTYYRVWVKAFTAKGEGSDKRLSYIKTKCGSAVHNSSGVIQSPGFPKRIEYSDCTWDIDPGDEDKSVLLAFPLFNIPLSYKCENFYVSVSDDSGVRPELLCGQRDTFFFLAQKLHIDYKSTRYTESWQGFQAQYLVINESIINAPVVNDWNISILSVEYSSMNVSWAYYFPDHPYILAFYAVVCTPTNNDAGPTVAIANYNGTRIQLEVLRLRAQTEYSVQVLAVTVHSESGAFSFKGSQIFTVRTIEGVPSEPPGNVTALSPDSNTINVSWSHIANDSVNGVLRGYKVFYRSLLGDGKYSMVRVGPSTLQVIISDKFNYNAIYEVRVAGETAVGVGVKSESVTVKPGCMRGYLHETMGKITSPGFPEDYPNDLICYWVMAPGLPEYRLFLAFDTFRTEDVGGKPNCTDFKNDLIIAAAIFDSRRLVPYCGNRKPFALIIEANSSNLAAIQFKSNLDLVEQGFNASYLAVDKTPKISVSVVDGSITGHEVTLTLSPTADANKVKNYIVLYKPALNGKREWTFKRSENTQITLRSLKGLTKYKVMAVGYTSDRDTYGSQEITFETLEAAEPETTTVSIISPTPEPIALMYPYGDAAGDSIITFDISGKKCFRINIPDGGIAFFGKRHRKLHVCPNGVVQFESERFNRWPYRFGQRYWLRYDPILAPYWSNIDLVNSFVTGPSKVFYQIYSDSIPGANTTLIMAMADVMKLLSRPLPTNFSASWVLVVTWEKLRPREYTAASQNLMNTFQAVIITDGVYAFVMFNYPEDGIQWSAPSSVSNHIHYTNYRGLPVMGWNAGDDTGNLFNYKRSGTVGVEGIDSLVGNTGIIGKWFFRLENSKGEQDAIQKCLRWFKNQPDPASYTDAVESCPCTLRQAFFDERFQWTTPEAPFTYCVYTRFPSAANRGRQCCYHTRFDTRFGALIVGYPDGGVIHRYHKLASKSLYLRHQFSDVLGFKYCCVQSKLCERFFRKRPSEGCQNYVPPVWSWLWGDPHFVTLDGGNYTFNGLGEYTMVNAKNGHFELQARTKLAKGGGTATVFAAAVAKEVNTSAVQVALKDGGGLKVLVDGEVFQGFDSLTNVSLNLNGSVAVSRPENSSFLVTFPSGISVTVTEVKESLSIVFAAPVSFKGFTKGLLGTWNDDALDDFLRPDGTTLNHNATGREIHYNFGQKWQVTFNTSLFAYNPGEDVNTFKNESFEPLFLDNITFASDALRQQAEAICQGDVNCLFDIASTGDTAVGESTKQISVQLESESEELHNFPPKILSGPSELNLTVNTTVSITVTAEDPNGDPVTFNVSGSLPKGAKLSTNVSSVTLTWNVTTEEIDIEFVVADDSKQATVLRPLINVCACHNQGTCVPVDENDADSSGQRFNILACVCQNGYTGIFCEADLDACEENFQPCYPGVQCIDLKPPANESGFDCGPCPDGLTGDGVECTDIDECATNNGGCGQNCLNNHGSFECDCDAGYVVNPLDKKSCADVDECGSGRGGCMQICENTLGSYTCKCDADFKVDPANPKDCIAKYLCPQNLIGCDDICFLSDGKEKCACRKGYALQQDGKTCRDKDECESFELNSCDQRCNNTDGGYVCSCVHGYTLDADSFTCNDIDECLLFTYECQDESMQCENKPGSYDCVCGEGLYWIDNKCQGLEKGAEPPPPPPAEEPRTPSDEERSQSVELLILGLNVSQWNQPLQAAFKAAVATAATKHCSETDDCRSTPTSARRKRAASFIIFTEDQVHILPGYPKQIFMDPLLASLAFYLQFPPGTSNVDAITKDNLVSIVKGSMADISNSINGNISSVQTLVAETSTMVTSTVAPSRPIEKASYKMPYIIAGSVAGGLLVIIIAVIIIVKCSNPKNRIPKRIGDSPQDKSKVEMEVLPGSINHAYNSDQPK
ncbi:uncharacterized protein [Montipora foliosa]|uniref:uncharacterized protein isoform X4 n=1 Tax=Montipora foliosa TaxID=591990 RepID=UPI0035F1B7AA